MKPLNPNIREANSKYSACACMRCFEENENNRMPVIVSYRTLPFKLVCSYCGQEYDPRTGEALISLS